MNGYDAFRPADLDALDRLLSQAGLVVPMDMVADLGPNVIGMRHDVDHSLDNAVKMARWERERGYGSTYFILHTAAYWQDKARLRDALDEIWGLNHEIGFHVNALAEQVRGNGAAEDIAFRALDELRSLGHAARGVVAHGDPACYLGGKIRFVNDEMFCESPRPELGAPDRLIEGTDVRIRPLPRAAFGLTYDPNWLSRADYISDSGGRWNKPLPTKLPADGQLHMLVHADWWGAALA